MSEVMDKVRGVRELPLFPLPVVLFPGVPLPLHIFEPRYRQMLSDIRVSNNLFGLSYFDSSSSENEIPPPGHVGCVAEVTEIEADVKQVLLELRSTSERLWRLRNMLQGAVSSYEERARVHELAKGNG